ncbi:aminotransferase class IV [Methylobacterium sp. WL116]|uniref:aminotransferase class IV n=1 Tax=Methylobacterium sp. WL116 TaxID=2603889 RepID=UPI0011C805CB|nr:aminotransferase class IV [Methylobacterium sp. WL116]TXM88590.1 class IV aminotransferase [Methylobacterium sp. WL116]
MLWHDGRLIDGTTLPFDLTDRGLTLADGVFDTALALAGRVAFADAHVARLVASAEALGFSVPADAARTAMHALAATGDRLAIRTTVTRGIGPRGLAPPPDPRPTLFATAAVSDRRIAFAPLRLWPTAIARNETSPLARLKTLGYGDAILAARDARAAGFDEALFCNTRRHLACAGTGNVFALFGDRLVTPPLGDGVLAGIVRAVVIADLAPACGLACEERSATRAELRRADAVLVTNSLRLVAPVAAIGDTAYATDHPVLMRLIAALRDRVAAECGVPASVVA